MNERIKHRGPDDDGVVATPDMTLAMRRLSILDTSRNGHQPMRSEDGRYIIIHNGEIYNFQEIRDELKKAGHTFISNSDTEVALHAYMEYGKSCVAKFNGMFAFAIWDAKEKRLFAARDHAGIKPFFYFFDGKRLIFSSELKGLFVHNIKKEIDYTSFASFVRFSYINGPETIFKNIYTLLPGHTLTYSNGNIVLEKYWEMPTEISSESFDVLKSKLRDTFDDSVKRQLVSDRPLGIFLGGGIDSTAVLGSMSRITSEKIKTFSVRFDTDVQGDKFNEDSDVAKQTAKVYGTEHHELVITAKDVVTYFEDLVMHSDSLTANNSAIAPYLLSRYAKKHVDVVLGGDGGDELFGGYERYYHFLRIAQLQKVPLMFRDNPFTKSLFTLSGKEDYYQRLNADRFELFWLYRAQKENLIRPLLKNINHLDDVQKRYRDKYFSKASKYDLSTQLMSVDYQSWLVDESLTKSDGMTMAAGIEQRVPILDKEMIELAFTIPAHFKVKNRLQGKYIFKEAVRDYLPDEVYYKKKTGWFAPTSKWFRTDMQKLAYEILSPGYTKHTKDILDFDAIQKLLKEHIEIKTYALNVLWSLMVFQVWYRQMMEDKE